jgi:hypothetical protein
MANSKYSQVVDLLAAGKFNWQVHSILGVLRKDSSLDVLQKKLSDLDGTEVARTEIQGRAVLEGGACVGYPAFFQVVPGDTDYQMVLVQDRGDGDPNLIAWFDTNEADGPLRLDNTGTLVVRPGEPDDPLPDGVSASTRLWMRL